MFIFSEDLFEFKLHLPRTYLGQLEDKAQNNAGKTPCHSATSLPGGLSHFYMYTKIINEITTIRMK